MANKAATKVIRVEDVGPHEPLSKCDPLQHSCSYVTHLAELAPTHHGGVVPVIATVHRGQTHWPDVVIEHYLKKNIKNIASNKSM